MKVISQQAAMPLALAPVGQDVCLVGIHGGRHIRRRLADLGLNPGMKVRVVSSGEGGPLILAVKDSRLALGRGMAFRVMVRPLDDGELER